MFNELISDHHCFGTNTWALLRRMRFNQCLKSVATLLWPMFVCTISYVYSQTNATLAFVISGLAIPNKRLWQPNRAMLGRECHMFGLLWAFTTARRRRMYNAFRDNSLRSRSCIIAHFAYPIDACSCVRPDKLRETTILPTNEAVHRSRFVQLLPSMESETNVLHCAPSSMIRRHVCIRSIRCVIIPCAMLKTALARMDRWMACPKAISEENNSNGITFRYDVHASVSKLL